MNPVSHGNGCSYPPLQSCPSLLGVVLATAAGKQGESGRSLGVVSASGLQGWPGLGGTPSPAMSIPPWLEAILAAKAGVFHKNFPASDQPGPCDLAEV